MPIYMDIHVAPGVKAKDVAEAHRLDMLMQDEYQCKCMTYWIDEIRENVFCLIEAPGKEAVEQMHARAHGMLPNRIIEVSSSLVASFLGRIYDPANVTYTDEGLKVFHDSSYRILLVTRISDPALLSYKLGTDKANAILAAYTNIVRKHLRQFGGREAEHEGSAFVASFCAASSAVSCALNIRKDMLDLEDARMIDFSTAVNAGDPVEESDQLFGNSLQMAGYMCMIAKNFDVAISSSVKELVSKDFSQQQKEFFTLSSQDESLLAQLFKKLDENWQDAEFDMSEYCQAMIMSKSQLYRKAIAFTGLSPNMLLKDYRLEKAKELMKKKHYNISQITFESGFTSPSYFTKCFKKKYGLLPMAYMDLLH